MNVSWWGRFWLRVLTWAFRIEAPRVHGGNLAIVPPMAIAVPVRQDVVRSRCLPPVRCRVRQVPPQASRCTVRTTSHAAARVCTVCAPSAIARQQAVSLAIRAQAHKLVPLHATLAVSHRVLIGRTQPAVRARIRLLPKRVGTSSVNLRWRCQARSLTIERFGCREVASSLVWHLPMCRRAVPFGRLSTEHRLRCRKALQRAAKGYAHVQSVYYPVPAHAVARLEIDERLGVLYIYPRRGRTDTPSGCLWVVSGVQVPDGRPVRAVLRAS
ncbi:MAG: hypothetical protein ACUVTY_15130 [Armatimonadota bacterium]